MRIRINQDNPFQLLVEKSGGWAIRVEVLEVGEWLDAITFLSNNAAVYAENVRLIGFEQTTGRELILLFAHSDGREIRVAESNVYDITRNAWWTKESARLASVD